MVDVTQELHPRKMNLCRLVYTLLAHPLVPSCVYPLEAADGAGSVWDVGTEAPWCSWEDGSFLDKTLSARQGQVDCRRAH